MDVKGEVPHNFLTKAS